jgi:hypothetical protein
MQTVRAALQQQSRIPERISRHLNDQISALREAFLVKGLKDETPEKSYKILEKCLKFNGGNTGKTSETP